MITELFYSRIININRGSIHKEFSGVYTSPFSDTDELKMALRARKVSGSRNGPHAVLNTVGLSSRFKTLLPDDDFDDLVYSRPTPVFTGIYIYIFLPLSPIFFPPVLLNFLDPPLHIIHLFNVLVVYLFFIYLFLIYSCIHLFIHYNSMALLLTVKSVTEMRNS